MSSAESVTDAGSGRADAFLLGCEERLAGFQGLHMNFVFGAGVAPNHEFSAWRWVGRGELDRVACKDSRASVAGPRRGL